MKMKKKKKARGRARIDIWIETIYPRTIRSLVRVDYN